MVSGVRLSDGSPPTFPAFSFVAVRGGFSYSQHGIEQQNALLRPSGQVSVRRRLDTEVVMYFFENIDKPFIKYSPRRTPPHFRRTTVFSAAAIFQNAFFENIDKRRRRYNPFLHRKAKPVCLSRSVIGVLSENHSFGLAAGGQLLFLCRLCDLIF